MRLEQLLAYLDGHLPEPERADVEAYLATAEGQQARRAVGLLRRSAREAIIPTAEPCEHLEETCALADGALEGEERQAAEAHLLACPACCAAYCDLQQQPLAATSVPPAVLDRVLEPPSRTGITPRLAALPASAFNSASRPATPAITRSARRWWQGGAAGLAVAAVLIAVVWHPGSEPRYDLPVGSGEAGGSGHAVTTSISASREGNAATLKDVQEARLTPEQHINALLQELQQAQDNTAARRELALLYERLGKKTLAIKHFHLLQATLLHQGHVGGRVYAETEQRLQALER